MSIAILVIGLALIAADAVFAQHGVDHAPIVAGVEAMLVLGTAAIASLTTRRRARLADGDRSADHQLVGPPNAPSVMAFAVDDGGIEAPNAGVGRAFEQQSEAARVADLAQQRLHETLEALGLPAVTLGPGATIRFANRAARELVGASSGALEGRSAFAAFAGDQDELAEPWRRALASEAPGSGVPLPLLRSDGTQRVLRWHLTPQLNASATEQGRLAIGEDASEGAAAVDRVRGMLDGAPVSICAVDESGRVELAHGAPFSSPVALDDLPPSVASGLRGTLAGSAAPTTVEADGQTFDATFRLARGLTSGARIATAVLVETNARTQLAREAAWFGAAIRASADAVIITDREGVITYVNPAFEATSGYTAAEVLGQQPNLLRSREHSREFFRRMWATIGAGQSWSGEIVSRRYDGSLVHEQATISPVRDGAGEVTSYVAVKRDLTRERELEAALDREARERMAFVSAIQSTARAGNPAELGDAVCQAAIRLPDVDTSVFLLFADEEVRTIASRGPIDSAPPAGFQVPEARGLYLRTRAQHGPWVDAWRPRAVDGDYGELVARSGIRAVAYIPLRDETRVTGLLMLGALTADAAERLPRRMPSFLALGTVASTQLAATLRTRGSPAPDRAVAPSDSAASGAAARSRRPALDRRPQPRATCAPGSSPQIS